MIRAEPVLVEAACSGDAAAVEKLLAVCQPDLRRFARRTCSTSEDAEDAVQVALWQLYRKVGALRTAATFATLAVQDRRARMLSAFSRALEDASLG